MENRQDVLNRLIEKYGEEVSDVEICSKEYAIVTLKNGVYTILSLNTFECLSYYQKIAKHSEGIYLADLLEGGQVFLCLEQSNLIISERFKKLVKGFEKSSVVETYSNERKMMHKSPWSGFSWKDSLSSDSKESAHSTKYAILNLLNGKKAFVMEKGFLIPDIEFESVGNYCDKESNDIFRIVCVSGEKHYRVFRIKDFKLSEQFSSISRINPFYRDSSIGYVEVTLSNGKKSIMRIEDFEISPEFNKITCLSYQFVAVNDGESVMKLSDFSLARWEKK